MKMLVCTFALVLVLAVMPRSAIAEPYMRLGRALDIPTMPNYCPLGKTPRQRDLVEARAKMASAAMEILVISAPCSELPAFDAGTSQAFRKMLVVAVVKAHGVLRTDPRSRAEFIRMMNDGKPYDAKALSQRVLELAKGVGGQVGFDLSRMTTLGEDRFAVYSAAVGEVRKDGRTAKVALVQASLLVSQLPLAVQATELLDGESTGTSPAVLVQQYVEAIALRN
ncbi:MAG TPA: hypothetical protein VES00_17935 [Burkholderiaceae bacterium]|nr:hypothetical protein [Burkholderiaceae bacterium]